MVAWAVGAALALQAVSSYIGAKQAKSQAKIQSDVIKANAQLDLQESIISANLLRIQADRTARESRRSAGRIVAGLAVNQGVSGSALDVLADVAREQQLEIDLAFHTADLEERAARSRFEIAQFDSSNVRRSGKVGQFNEIVRGGSSILGTTAALAGK